MSTGTTGLDQMHSRLLGFGLAHAAERLPEAMSEAVRENRPGHELLAHLLGHEHESRRSGGSAPRSSCRASPRE